MIEFLKIVGSALITALVTIYAMHVKRRWEKQDKSDEKKEAEEDKIDKMSNELAYLGAKVDKLSTEFEKEITDIRRQDRGLQAGLREILYDRIKFLAKKFIGENKIREEDYNSLHRMWNVYHEELNGNGYLDGVMREVEELDKY